MMRLSTVWIVCFQVLSLGPLGVVASLDYYQARNQLHQEITGDLRTIADSRVWRLEEFLTERKVDVTLLAQDPSVIEAVGSLTATFPKVGLEGPEYRKIDRHLGPYLTVQREVMGYRDVLLLSVGGDVLFSAARDRNLGANVRTGACKDTPLARAFENASLLLETEMSPFAPYPPDNEATAFIAAPVEKDGATIGVLAVRLGTQRIAAIREDHAGLGRTGEVLVGQRMGHEVVFLFSVRQDPNAAFRRRISLADFADLPLARAAQGENDEGRSQDYLGHEVWAVWRYLPTFNWGVVVKIDHDEAFAPVVEMRNRGLATAGLVGLVVVGAGVGVARMLGRPLRTLSRAATRLARGDTSLPAVQSSLAEMRDLAQAFDGMARQIVDRTTQLAAKEAKLQAILDHAPAVVFVKDLDGRHLFINRQFEQVLHVTRADFLGRTDYELFPRDVADALRANDQAVLAAGTARESEEVVPNDDGPHTYISLKFPLRDADGRPYAICGIATDITERKRAEEVLQQLTVELETRVQQRTDDLKRANAALRASEEDLAALLDASPEALGVVNVRTGLFESPNPRAEQLFGLSGVELARVGPIEMSPAHQPDGRASADAAWEYINAALQGGTPIFEWVHCNAQGERIPCEVRLLALAAPRQHLIRFSVTDIRLRKRAEKAVTERARLATLLGEVGIALTTEGTLRGNLQRCAEALVRGTDAAFARIWTLNEAEQVLELQASAGMYTHLDGPHGRVPVGQFKIGRIAQERRPHLTNQVIGDPRVGD
jgi:PAS domain S-box-containing protein